MWGGGLQDRSQNKNSYPMTSAHAFPSAVTIRVNGEVAARHELADDPADSRGILSWNAQPFDRTLTEAGSYGELLRIPVSAAALAASATSGELVIRLEVSDALPGGLAVYGARFGRYPGSHGVVRAARLGLRCLSAPQSTLTWRPACACCVAPAFDARSSSRSLPLAGAA
jgi:hypothetical protein